RTRCRDRHSRGARCDDIGRAKAGQGGGAAIRGDRRGDWHSLSLGSGSADPEPVVWRRELGSRHSRRHGPAVDRHIGARVLSARAPRHADRPVDLAANALTAATPTASRWRSRAPLLSWRRSFAVEDVCVTKSPQYYRHTNRGAAPRRSLSSERDCREIVVVARLLVPLDSTALNRSLWAKF